jgi:hypothetical protein
VVTDIQLYLTIGIPTLAIVLAYSAIVAKLAAIDTRIGEIKSGLRDFTSRLALLAQKFDTTPRH